MRAELQYNEWEGAQNVTYDCHKDDKIQEQPFIEDAVGCTMGMAINELSSFNFITTLRPH